MSEVERPVGSDSPPTGGLTSTVSPAGVSAFPVSGAVVIVGPKPRCFQPVRPVGVPLLSCQRIELSTDASSGCCQVLVRSLKIGGSGACVTGFVGHAVGNV